MNCKHCGKSKWLHGSGDLLSVIGPTELLKTFCKYCEDRQIEPKRFKWDEIIKDFELEFNTPELLTNPSNK